MPVPVEKEPDDTVAFLLTGVFERCCICRALTAYWTKLSDRKPGEQVALCKYCAWEAMPNDIPSKKDWCRREHLIRASSERRSTFLSRKPA